MHVLVESCTCARSHQVAYVRVYSICIIRVLVCSPVAWSYPFHATSTWSSVKHKTFAKPMDMMVCLNIATPALTNSSSLSLVSVPSTSACSVCLNGQFWSKKVILGLTRSQMLSADLFCMHLHLLIESAFSSSSKPSLLVTSSPDFPDHIEKVQIRIKSPVQDQVARAWGPINWQSSGMVLNLNSRERIEPK